MKETTELRLKLILFAIALLVLVLHAWHYMPFIADDALISLRYSQRLLAGHGLTWNPGERVEGYSNLLWVLAASALGLLRIDLVVTLRILGILGMAATLAALLYPQQLRSWRAAVLIFLVVAFVSLSGTAAAWTIGGMEQPLVVALLAWSVALLYARLESNDTREGQLLLPGLLLALLALTRLDGALFTAAAASAVLISGRFSLRSWRRACALAALPILFVLLQVAFRRVYYGEWIPNTALVKFNPSGKHTLDGWGYLRAGGFAMLPLIIAAATGMAISFWSGFQRSRMILLGALALSWMLYLVIIGGDIFPAWRHFVPLLVLLVFMAAVAAQWIASLNTRNSFLLATVCAALLLAGFTWLQLRDEENFRAISERWEWDGEAIGTLLKHAFGAQQPLLAVDPAGCLPYWSELPTVDMLGLNDYYLPRHPPPDVGQGAIGHELGNGQYVLNREPDLIIFLLPTGNDRGYFLSGRQMQEDPRFFREYTLVRFESPAPRQVVSRVWARRYSPRIGIRQSFRDVTIPGFLLNGNHATAARLGTTGRLIVPVAPALPAIIADLELPSGRWQIAAAASGASLRIRVLTANDPANVLLDAVLPARLELSQPSRVSIELLAMSGATEVEELKLMRVD